MAGQTAGDVLCTASASLASSNILVIPVIVGGYADSRLVMTGAEQGADG